jgi:diacylglycerol kinase family enzyme
VQCDGDDMARLPVEIDVMPEALSLVVPKEGPYG